MSFMPSSVLITGANRGIGLEFVRQLLDAGCPLVVGVTRNINKSVELNELQKKNANRLKLVEFDVTNFKSMDSFVQQVTNALEPENSLHWLINNAGANFGSSLQATSPEDMLRNYEVNTVAPLFVVKALMGLLQQSTEVQNKPLIINITSRMGSIDDNTSGGYYAYRASKTALNQVTRCLSWDLASKGIQAVAVHPGWVKTDMGGVNAKLTVQTSVSSMLNFLLDGKRNYRGDFLDYDGTEIKW